MRASRAISPPDQGVLLNLVEELHLDQVRALPPLSIPRLVIDAVEDPAKREALKHLDARAATGASAPARPQERAQAAALAATEKAGTTGVAALRERLREFRRPTPAGQDGGEWRFERVQELEAIRDLATDLAAAAAGLGAVRDTLARPQGSNGRAERIAAAASRLPDVIADFHAALADYHRLEIRLVGDEMRARRADCELEARKYLERSDQVQHLRQRLSRGWLRRTIGGDKLSRGERGRLTQRLERLTERQQLRHTFVEADEVQRWLNTLVDAALYLPPADWEEEARDARWLVYQMLNIHCLQGVLPAEEVAVDCILRRDARERLDYQPITAAFIEHYFENRRADEPLPYARANSVGEERFERACDLMLGEYRRDA